MWAGSTHTMSFNILGVQDLCRVMSDRFFFWDLYRTLEDALWWAMANSWCAPQEHRRLWWTQPVATSASIYAQAQLLGANWRCARSRSTPLPARCVLHYNLLDGIHVCMILFTESITCLRPHMVVWRQACHSIKQELIIQIHISFGIRLDFLYLLKQVRRAQAQIPFLFHVQPLCIFTNDMQTHCARDVFLCNCTDKLNMDCT